MIFVTVGTHEQQFNRLVQEVDMLKKRNQITEPVFIQSGYSDYIPQHCEYKKVISFEEMTSYMNQASIIITHGGPASFMQVISLGKKPIVVPRQFAYNEHVNNHQLEFAKQVSKRGYDIELVEEISCLKDAIKNNPKKSVAQSSNNNSFNTKFSSIINHLIGE